MAHLDQMTLSRAISSPFTKHAPPCPAASCASAALMAADRLIAATVGRSSLGRILLLSGGGAAIPSADLSAVVP